MHKSVTQTAEVIHLGYGTMEEMLIIPRAEAPDLVQKHSALLMEDGPLSYAARLAARQERLLTDLTLPEDKAIDRLSGCKTNTEKVVKKIIQAKVKLKMLTFNTFLTY